MKSLQSSRRSRSRPSIDGQAMQYKSGRVRVRGHNSGGAQVVDHGREGQGRAYVAQGPNSIEKIPTEKPTENPTEIPYTKKKSKNGKFRHVTESKLNLSRFFGWFFSRVFFY